MKRNLARKFFRTPSDEERIEEEDKASRKSYINNELGTINTKLENLVNYEQSPIGPFPKESAYGLEKVQLFPNWDEEYTVLFETVTYFLEKMHGTLKLRAKISKIHNARADTIWRHLFAKYPELFLSLIHI